MNTKHTPTPWATDCFETEKEDNLIISSFDLIQEVAYCKDKANAELIVKAVNSHEALIEALRMARIALTPHVFIDDDAKRARNKADEALKQAGEL